MTVSVVFAIAGVIALLFGIVGGGIKAKEVEIPLLPAKARVVTIVIGLVLIGVTMWLESNKLWVNQQIPAVETVTPLPTNDISLNPSTVDTSTPAAAPTTVPTQTPTNSDLVNLYAKLSQAKTWPLILQDSFDNNDNQWTLWNVDDTYKTETMQIGDGVFQWGMQLKVPNSWFLEIAPVTSYSDFYYSAKMRRVGKPTEEQVGQAIWGIVFRRQGNDCYAFLLNDLQEYSLYLDRNNVWTALVGQMKNTIINSERTNELAVIADGADITLFINGTALKTINDSALSDGNIGFYAGLVYPDDEVRFEFDDVELRQKP